MSKAQILFLRIMKWFPTRLTILKQLKMATNCVFFYFCYFTQHIVPACICSFERSNITNFEMTLGQAFRHLSDPGYFVFFCYYILAFVTIKIKFKPNQM